MPKLGVLFKVRSALDFNCLTSQISFQISPRRSRGIDYSKRTDSLSLDGSIFLIAVPFSMNPSHWWRVYFKAPAWFSSDHSPPPPPLHLWNMENNELPFFALDASPSEGNYYELRSLLEWRYIFWVKLTRSTESNIRKNSGSDLLLTLLVDS